MDADYVRHATKTLLAERKRVGCEGTAALNREALRLLEDCERWNLAPPKELIGLIARQLKVARARNETPCKRKRGLAEMACARDSTLSNKRLARACDVSLPTIARWRKNPRFSEEVEWLRSHPWALGPPNTSAEILRGWIFHYDADGRLYKAGINGTAPDPAFFHAFRGIW